MQKSKRSFFSSHCRKTATSVSGLDWDVIAPCAKWMEPYFLVICDENEASPLALLESNEQVKSSYGLAHVCPNLVADSSHIVQTHTTSLDMFVSVSLVARITVYLSSNAIHSNVGSSVSSP